MGTISLPTTFVDGTIPSAAQFNGDLSTIVNEFNGNIDNSNIKSGAGILESKIAFNISTGHSHNGVDSKLITTRATYGSLLAGVLVVTNDIGLNPRVRAAATVTRISGYARTAPVGADLIVRVWNVTQGLAVATLTITAGNNAATSTSITNASIASGDILRFDCTQIGSGTPGSNCTLQIDCTE